MIQNLFILNIYFYSNLSLLLFSFFLQCIKIVFVMHKICLIFLFWLISLFYLALFIYYILHITYYIYIIRDLSLLLFVLISLKKGVYVSPLSFTHPFFLKICLTPISFSFYLRYVRAWMRGRTLNMLTDLPAFWFHKLHDKNRNKCYFFYFQIHNTKRK